jgi:regulator of protease activity HflC (stomatin/prohibitin superfamily)
MFGIQYFKADPSTYVIQSTSGKTLRRGNGLNFFYNSATSSIASVPINAQEAPFIFSLQTADFQEIRVQGQITYRITDPQKISEVLNFNLKKDGRSYSSEDPLKLSDRVVRAAQTMVQITVQAANLRDSLVLNQALVAQVKAGLSEQSSLQSLGIDIVDATIASIAPAPETTRALEAKARESILKLADDAIYLRRKSAVEQERTIKEAELQTDLFIQQKEQEIEESRITNERVVLRGQAETERERIQAGIDAENQRKELVILNAENSKQEADAEAYGIAARMNAFKELPVENLKAMAIANMQPDQLMAVAFDSMAQNAEKIGELNIGPDIFGAAIRKSVRK